MGPVLFQTQSPTGVWFLDLVGRSKFNCAQREDLRVVGPDQRGPALAQTETQRFMCGLSVDVAAARFLIDLHFGVRCLNSTISFSTLSVLIGQRHRSAPISVKHVEYVSLCH